MKYSLTAKRFHTVLVTSKSLVTGDLSFKYKKVEHPGLGLIVSRKFGKAYQRNLFKRRCRSLYKTFLLSRPGYALIVRPHKQIYDYDRLAASFLELTGRMSN